jgi:hypothetical protein
MRSSSAKLVLLWLKEVPGSREFLNQSLLADVVGFHQILQRMTMIPQLRVHQAHQQVRVHLHIIRKIHAAGD